MMSLILAALPFALPTALAATPPPTPTPIDPSGVLDLGASPEEQMVSGGLPSTPESGKENPEDLLRSAPTEANPPKQSATALPESLPLAPEAGLPTEPLESVTVPGEPAAPVADAGESATSTRKWDRSVPLYDREKPSWAFEIHASLQALGTPIKSEQLDTNGNTTGVIEESDVRNFGVGFEYEPKFLQGIGVVSLGPSLNAYILEPQGDLTKNAFSVYSLGLSAKYQLKFARAQIFVPFVGFEVQTIRYSFQEADIGDGWTTATGLTFGGLILLNGLEPEAAHNLWAETGIKHSYLVAEIKQLQAGLDLLTTDGRAIYFGLRLEY